MKKRGFTLVELLAVIAILAILVIIALPNIMGMFNTAKKNSFTTEVKEIYKIAQQQWISDSMFDTQEQEYGRCNGCSYKGLDLTGRQEIKYYIKIDKAGKVVKYTANDGTYTFSYSGDGLLIENITNDMINNSTEEGINNDRYVYYAKSTHNPIEYTSFPVITGQRLLPEVQVYSSYTEALNNSNSSGGEYNEKTFVRLKLSNDIITEQQIGYIFSGVHYITNEYTEANKAELRNVFGSSNCRMRLEIGAYVCGVEDMYVSLYESNMINVSSGSWYCSIEPNGSSSCIYVAT